MSKTQRSSEQQLLPFDTSFRSAATAPRQAGGFSYQLLYATLKALELTPGDLVGFEFLDDVAVVGKQGDRYFQIKNEARPLTDMDKGLWKALSHWAHIIKQGPRHDLQLAPNAPAPFGALAHDFRLTP